MVQALWMIADPFGCLRLRTVYRPAFRESEERKRRKRNGGNEMGSQLIHLQLVFIFYLQKHPVTVTRLAIVWRLQ